MSHRIKITPSPLLILVIFASLIIITVLWFIGHFSQTKSSLSSSKNSGVLSLSIPERVAVTTQFPISLVVDSKGMDINAVGAYIKFDPDFVQLTNLDTTSSFCQFYPEKKFDNQQGSIRIACGSPNPGFNGTNTLAKFKFNAIRAGLTKINILPESQILKNDGLGTNIINHYPSYSLLIINSI